MSLATRRIICWIRGHDMGRWRRVTMGATLPDLRQRRCRRCGTVEEDMASPRKRPANGGDTVTP